MDIHPTAMVHAAVARPATGAIGPFCIVEAGVVLEEGVELGPNCVVYPGTHIGSGTRLDAHVVLGGAPQDRRHDPAIPTMLTIGRNNIFREFSTAHRGTSYGRGRTVIGDGNLFMVGAHVGHDATVGRGCTLANGVALAGFTEVGDDVVFGGLSAVHQHGRVGRLAMVGGGAMCAQDVPPFTLVQGDRARLRGLNVVGLRRQGFEDQIPPLKRVYRLLFLEGLPRQEALKRVSQLGEALPLVAELIAFVQSSKRGVCRAAGS